MIVDIEVCDIFDDDDDYLNNRIIFALRDDDGNLLDYGGYVDGGVDDAFCLQRSISEYVARVYVCVLSGNIHNIGGLHEDVYMVNGLTI